MKHLIVHVLPLLLLGAAAFAQDSAWKDEDGNPVPESESRKSQDGFSGMLLVTPDQDWQEKWETPESHIPRFTEAERVSVGGVLTIMIFFSNPLEDQSGSARVQCDLRVIRPDRTYSVDLNGAECFSGSLAGRPHNVRLSGVLLQFVAEPTDLPGTWTTEVRLTDVVRDVHLDMRTTFELVADEA